MNVIIIGGGVSGLSCGIYLSRNKFNVKIFNGYSFGLLSTTPIIENYPGFPEKISGYELLEKIEKQAKKFGCEIQDSKVESVDYNNKIIKTDCGEEFTFDVLVIATGVTYKKLDINSEFDNVHYCATCDGLLYLNKDVAVVGGGDTALTEALYLSDICNNVYLIHRRNIFRGTKILIDKILCKSNIHLILDNEIIEFVGNKKFDQIILKNNFKLKVDGAFIAIGNKPNTELLGDSFIIRDNKVINLSSVYVCGDINNYYKQAIIAAGDGVKTAIDIINDLMIK